MTTPRRRYLRLWAPLLLALSLVAAACGSDTEEGGSEPEGEEPAAGEPRQGGELVIARTADVKQLDPLEAVETETIFSLNMVMETLLFTAPDGQGTQPALAESVEPSDDGLTWTVSLREGVLFHDGSELDAGDVKFSLDRARTSDEGFAYLLAPITSVEVVDDLTVELATETPLTYVPALLALWSGAIIPEDFGGVSEEEFFEAPIGTGPFEYESWEPGQEFSVVRNDEYWQEGKPYLDGVTWTQVSDDNARVVQLRGDQADVIASVPFSAVEELEASEGFTVEEFPSTLQYYVMFNTSVEPFGDVAVRRAIAQAIDKESIKEAALFGRGEVACSVLPPTMAFFDPDTPCLAYDPEAAAEELASSSVPDGFSTSLLIGGTDVQANTTAEIIVENLAELGIEVEITRVDPAQLYETQSRGDFEMIIQGWQSDIPDPDQQITFMLDPVGGGVDSYHTFYDNPDVTAAIEAARVEFDDAARGELYAEVQATHAEEVPQVPLVFQPFVYAWSDQVQGLSVLPTGNYFLQDVWLEG